jgi:hypothetical protein
MKKIEMTGREWAIAVAQLPAAIPPPRDLAQMEAAINLAKKLKRSAAEDEGLAAVRALPREKWDDAYGAFLAALPSVTLELEDAEFNLLKAGCTLALREGRFPSHVDLLSLLRKIMGDV